MTVCQAERYRGLAVLVRSYRLLVCRAAFISLSLRHATLNAIVPFLRYAHETRLLQRRKPVQSRQGDEP